MGFLPASAAPAAGGGGSSPIYYKKKVKVNTTRAIALAIEFEALALSDGLPGSITTTTLLEKANGSVYSTTVDITAGVGVGGLDAGAEASSTLYSVFALYNPTTEAVGAVLSTAADEPTLPSGYTLFRKVGEVYNDSSSDLVAMTRVDDNVYFEQPQNVFSNVALDANWDAYSYPPAIPLGTEEVFLTSGRFAGGGTAFNIQVLRPSSDPGYEVASENVASSSTTNTALHALYRVVDHPPMVSLGLGGLEVRCNGTGFGNLSCFARGYRKAI